MFLRIDSFVLHLGLPQLLSKPNAFARLRLLILDRLAFGKIYGWTVD